MMNTNIKEKFLIFVALISLSVTSRLIPHPWSFTCVGSVILFSMFYFNNKKIGIITTLFIIVISDFLLFEFSGIPRAGFSVYLCWLLYIPSSMLIDQKLKFKRIGLAGFTGATLFYVVSNFLVWNGTAMYPHTISGLITCYIAAIPFYLNHFSGDLVWSFTIFGIYKISTAYQVKLRTSSNT